MDARLIKISCLALALASCSEEEIHTYRVASSEDLDVTEVSSSGAEVAAPMRSVRWLAPEGWTEEPAGQFQVAVYRLGSGLKATVSMLPGAAGGVSANVNRWRGQVGLKPLAESEISGEEVAAYQGPGEFVLYELLGESEARQAPGIFAAILSLAGETWFFKMSGPGDELHQQRSAFVAFLGKVEVTEGSGHESHAPPAGKPAESEKPEIHFDVPEGWSKGGESSMRVASFRAAGDDGFEADIAVVPLPGDAGTPLENVNRWRAQLQLDPLENMDDPAMGETLEGQAGKFLLTHMKSSEPLFKDKFHGAISAAILKGSKYTWFLKMSGEARVVEANRSRFEEFVKSARFP